MMKIELPVTSVTLLEDRAHVTREGVVVLEAGTHLLVVEGVAPVLVDKTATARAITGTARPGKVRIVRQAIVSSDDRSPALQEIEARARALHTKRVAVTAARDLLETQATRFEKLAVLALAEAAEDAAFDRVETSSWRETQTRLRQEIIRCHGGILEADEALERLQEEYDDLRTQALALNNPATTRRADAQIEVQADEAGALRLRLTYLVPGACWRPYHRARLLEGDDSTQLIFESDGCVWQNTGEAWNNVELFFSTERPSLGVEVPRLSTDTVRTHKVGSTVSVAAREETVHTSGLGGTAKVASKVPGIDDGGEVRKLRALAPGTIPSDGRPHRSPVFSFTVPATTELRLAAELAPAVLLRSEQENGAALPLLAGPVDLIRDSGPVGRTKILYVAPGERFELGWGPELALRVSRERRELKEKSKLLSSWTTARHRVALRLSNIGPNSHTISVRERIPVSEVEKVKVELEPKATRPEATPDPDGFCTWQIHLGAFERQSIELAWKVARHDDVVGL